MTLRPADLPRDWAQPMIEAQIHLRLAGVRAEDRLYARALEELGMAEFAIARAKKAMEQAGEGK
jgi:hypothetical protein